MIAEKTDHRFLLRSVKFCNRIEKYTSLLGLKKDEIEELRNDTILFAYQLTNLDHYSSCTDGCTKRKLDNMKACLSHLAQLCKNSKNYTVQIGLDLGIEIPVHAFLAN